MVIEYVITPAFAGSTAIRVESQGRERWTVTVNSQRPQYGLPLFSESEHDASSSRRQLDHEESARILELLGSIRLPLQHDGSAGLDGVTYSLMIAPNFGLFTSMQLRWWLTLPRDWQVLEPLIEFLEDVARRCAP